MDESVNKRVPSSHGDGGEADRSWVDRLAASECPSLTQRRARRAETAGAAFDPIIYKAGAGDHVTDVMGRTYVDLVAGFGVAALGHCHPEVNRAVAQQLQMLPHALGDVHPSVAKVELLEELVRLSPWRDARVILGLSGSDAVEAALKTAVMYTGRPGVMAFCGSYHGLAYAPLAACGFRESFRSPFSGQLNPHVSFAPFPLKDTRDEVNDALRALDKLWDAAEAPIGAVLIEPVLGRGGVHPAPASFLVELKRRAQDRGAAFIADEIYTGLYRCGSLWRSEAAGVCPDIICTGKALGGGLPVSACMAPYEVMQAWGPANQEALHTSTFAGNPLGCAAALAVLRILRDPEFQSALAGRSAAFAGTLKSLEQLPHIKEVRTIGMLFGVECVDEKVCLQACQRLLEEGFITLTGGSRGQVLTLTPALTMSHAAFSSFVSISLRVFKGLEIDAL